MINLFQEDYWSMIPRDQARIKANSEFFTPRVLIEKMLDELEKDCPDIFSDPDKTFLDPACGDGNFGAAIIMRKIANGIDADTARESVFCVDICEDNVELCRERLGAEVECADFLSHNPFEGEDIDVVIGNPPYNAGRKVLWQEFALRGLDITSDYLSMIHPPRWRGPGVCSPRSIGSFRAAVQNHDLLWLDIHDMTSAQKHFKAGIRFDCYVLRKTWDPRLETHIIGEDGIEYKMNCKDREFIPNAQCDILDKIICKE